MNILFVFATKIENQLNSNKYDSIITGLGKLNASISLSKAIHSNKYDRIINLGICGSIDESIPLFTIFSISKVIEGDKDVFKGKNYLKLPTITNNLKTETLITQDRIIKNESQRNHISILGGKLVDMECYALAKTANAYKIPFYSFKIVSDYCLESSLKDIIIIAKKASHILCEAILTLDQRLDS
ncbi:hypothetical protein BVX93_01215 [bacterium B13(2017)]|nr:hypothetical protein BVX93_01215 [bacterium B13(2017)]